MKIVSEYHLRNHPAELRQIGPWVEAFARQARLAPPVPEALDLALVEWITNVIDYGWDDSEEHRILLRFQATAREVSVEVEDDGRPYDPRMAPLVDIHAPLETRAIGGLGIHLIRQLMDEVNYRRENARNILTLTKRIA